MTRAEYEALLKSREDFEAWTLRADRLQAAGDLWGRRIALSMAREMSTSWAEHQRLGRALDELDAAHGEHFYGAEYLALEAQNGFRHVLTLWMRGYIVHARVSPKNPATEGPEMAAVVRALVRSPAAEFLRDLIVRMPHPESERPGAVVSALLAGPPFAALEKLSLGCLDSSEGAMSQADLGDLSALWPSTPKLHTLRLRGSNIGLDRFELPSLQHLVIDTTRLPAASVRSLAVAQLPELRRMEVRTLAIDDLVPLFESTSLPKLEHLALRNSVMQGEAAIVIALARSNLLAQLRHVDLSRGTLGEPATQALIEHSEYFQQLESLDLRHNAIPEALHAPLCTAIPAVQIGEQQTHHPEGFHFYSLIGVPPDE